ncbi:Fc.00g081700.m01.CDS01 [Cosmosporella sp. VM-42]
MVRTKPYTPEERKALDQLKIDLRVLRDTPPSQLQHIRGYSQRDQPQLGRYRGLHLTLLGGDAIGRLGNFLYVQVTGLGNGLGSRGLVREGMADHFAKLSSFWPEADAASLNRVLASSLNSTPNAVYIHAEIGHERGLFVFGVINKHAAQQALLIAFYGLLNPRMCVRCCKTWAGTRSVSDELSLHPFHQQALLLVPIRPIPPRSDASPAGSGIAAPERLDAYPTQRSHQSRDVPPPIMRLLPDVLYSSPAEPLAAIEAGKWVAAKQIEDARRKQAGQGSSVA